MAIMIVIAAIKTTIATVTIVTTIVTVTIDTFLVYALVSRFPTLDPPSRTLLTGPTTVIVY